MNSINFPEIFKGNSTLINYSDNPDSNHTDKEATKVCFKLLLGSEIRELFGDPGFGIKLKGFTFNQNNYILKGILIDEIYTKISVFCPQVVVERDNIEIECDRTVCKIKIQYRYKKDFTTDTLNLVMTQENE